MNVLSVKVDNAMYERIERARDELDMNKTEFMTLALTLFLGSYQHIQGCIEEHMAKCDIEPRDRKTVGLQDYSDCSAYHTPRGREAFYE